MLRTQHHSYYHSCKIIEQENRDDTYINSCTYPIAFELPSNRPDLIETIMKAFLSQRTNTNLSTISYTFIGNIKQGKDGNLYYLNEPPSKETSKIINEYEKIFQAAKINQDKSLKEQVKLQKEKDFADRLFYSSQSEEQIKANYENKMRRIKEPYFRRVKDLYGKEGYDAINLESGNIMLIRNMKKYKDTSGRYLYTASVRQTNEETYTEYDDSRGFNIAFTIPSRLLDLIESKDNKPSSNRIVKALQILLSKSVDILERTQNANGLIDIGGVDLNGRIIENSPRYGVSSALVNQINKLGARKLDSLER